MRTREERFMALALRQARRGEGRTRPNPPVGAVLVRGERVLARGYHARAGENHAEIAALRQVGRRARGAELFVTLEPCAHRGRTPPCTDAIVEAGISRVVIGASDPNPRTDGRGIRRLRRAGVEVVTGVLAKPCARMIEGFSKLIRTGRPLVVLKLAATLDGRIAARTGHSRWVTGEPARREVHRLRNRCDAILVGAGTVTADDPALTCRIPRGRDPLRVIVSGRLSFPLNAQVVTATAPPGGPSALVATTRGSNAKRAAALRARGAEIMRLPSRRGRIDVGALLDGLGARDIMSVLVEGGSEVTTAFLEGGYVDRIIWFVAPKIVGGVDAIPAVGGLGTARMDQALRLRDLAVRRVGEDLMLDGRL
ncbi:MAG: bifunctional diaminohydroxyphosphoribosylaminopyrimidine deaminase/5-amino-6-(5-phosphoribosylamino)uracil reductase RibD [Deltaproteobacteria bacterium]|nr:bifunctional diaminohydroxyphosphoribosylaminopyrimidine deaminase/5-amino-6-(5-phosphoribosylamino)uracil reductase RibD [Deltaproteobacteria bacterium]